MDTNPETRESLYERMLQERDAMRDVVLQLQYKAEAGRRRARKRRPDRSKEQP